MTRAISHEQKLGQDARQQTLHSFQNLKGSGNDAVSGTPTVGALTL
jgi:hypothetical protein